MNPKTVKNKTKKAFYKRPWFIALAVVLLLGSFGAKKEEPATLVSDSPTTETYSVVASENNVTESSTESSNTVAVQETTENTVAPIASPKIDDILLDGKSYKIIEVAGGDTSGIRQPNVAVRIGFGDREYWGFTNEYSQLIYVKASKIVLQDATKEDVLSTGRYYPDEAKVEGTEREDLDEGHVIADSLGGVANAYNITPQDSILNRHGDQAYMEKVIKDAGGCSNFSATITYPSTKTQIPSHYIFQYEIQGNVINDEFDNVNPDNVNATLTEASTETVAQIAPVIPVTPPVVVTPAFDEQAEVEKIDTNGNGTVTIAEAKKAGFKMPIKSSHWLYKYMTDGDGDGQVGE